MIEGLCEDLRNDRRTQSIYIDRAEEIERELSLPAHCHSLKNLGQRSPSEALEHQERLTGRELIHVEQAHHARRTQRRDRARFLENPGGR